jgi:hypothetical protein
MRKDKRKDVVVAEPAVQQYQEIDATWRVQVGTMLDTEDQAYKDLMHAFRQSKDVTLAVKGLPPLVYHVTGHRTVSLDGLTKVVIELGAVWNWQ